MLNTRWNGLGYCVVWFIHSGMQKAKPMNQTMQRLKIKQLTSYVCRRCSIRDIRDYADPLLTGLRLKYPLLALHYNNNNKYNKTHPKYRQMPSNQYWSMEMRTTREV